MVSHGRIDITQLVNEARALAHTSRIAQTVAVLVTVAGLLTLARLRAALPTLHLSEVSALLLAPCVLGLALLLSGRLNLCLSVHLAELAEMQAFKNTRSEARSLLRRADHFAYTLMVQACVLVDSFVWNKIAVAAPTGLLAAHSHLLTLLTDTWRNRWRVPRVLQALEAHLRSLIDGRTLRNLIERLASWIVLPMLLPDARESVALAPHAIPERATLNEPLSINLRC